MDRVTKAWRLAPMEKPSLMGWAFEQLSISIVPIPEKLPASGKCLDWGELGDDGT
jgi:hypothetical protein